MNIVKYLSAIAFMLILAIGLMAGIPENNFDFDIRVHNYNAILCEPINAYIKITYKGNEPIEAYGYPKELYVNNEKIENYICNIRADIEKSGYVEKYAIKPGGSITLGDNLRCYSPFWKPGKYDAQYKVKINKELTLTTPSFRITVSEPTGIDKKVFDAGKTEFSPRFTYCIKDKSGLCNKDLWNPCSDYPDPPDFFLNISNEEIALNYSSSRYAAWLFASQIFDPIIDDPIKTAKTVRKNDQYYPPGNTLWDPTVKGKWIDLSDKKKYSKWVIDKASEIIKICPNFPDKDRLILAAGICNLVIGNELEGIEMMKKLIRESNSKEAIWAKQFLEEWEKQKTRQ